MKKKLFPIVIFTLVMLAFLACNNTNDFFDDSEFPEMSETTLDRTTALEVFKVGGSSSLEHFSSPECKQWYDDHYRTIFTCFDSSEQLKNSDYKVHIADFPAVNWDEQTLLVVHVFSRYGMKYDVCNVYSRSGKYTIEFKIVPLLVAALDDLGVAIVLDKKNITNGDIKLELSLAEEK